MNPTHTARDRRRSRRTALLIGTAVAAASIGAGGAWAQTPAETADEPTDAIEGLTEDPSAAEETPAEGPATTADETEAADQQPTDAEEPGEAKARRGPRLRLVHEEVTPNKVFYAGRRKAEFEYEFAGNKTVELLIEVVKSKGGPDPLIRRYRFENRTGGKKYHLKWDGKRKNGDHVKAGKFYFRVSEAGGQRLKRGGANGDRRFKLFPAIFPVDGGHQYWDGFGAGRGHQGQDVGANCGTPLRAAEPGKVTTKAYGGGGYGYYVVIDVKGKNLDELYAHLKDKATVRQGERVQTGERIGKVGATGNATGCHLHFEYRPNGSPSPKATKKLRAWDKYS